MSIEQFFQDNFVIPLGQYYTPVNTIIYGIIFALAVFGVYKLLRKLNISIDRYFVIGIVPYIVLGSVLRVLRDAKVLDYWLFASPIIYMLMFFTAFVALMASVCIAKFSKHRKGNISRFLSNYYRLWFVLGIVLLISAVMILIPIVYENYYASGIMLGIAGSWGAVFYALYRLREKFPKNKFFRIFTKENSILLATHLFDASTTFVALTFYPYYEQHVVSNFVIRFLGPAGQFVLKLVVVTIVLWALDNYLESDKDSIYLKNFLKIAIFILGFAPGFRNFLRVGFGV